MIAFLVLAATEAMTFTADRIAADNVTHALTASGHVVAVSKPFTVRGERLTRDVDGTVLFHDPTCATTCSNDVGHTHWNVSGEIAYKAEDYVLLRNMVLRFCEVPIFWLPYMYYPLDNDCGFSWMAGYTGRWGAYLLTKYAYHILGDAKQRDETTWWLDGATRFDLRYRQGLAFGEDLKWNLGDFGSGKFGFYYARDLEYQDQGGSVYGGTDWAAHDPGTELDPNRYSFTFNHRWEATERDTIRLQAAHYSDVNFLGDFNRSATFNWKSNIYSYENSGVFWEHLEHDFAVGAEASGRLNKFYEMTGRLPEIYFDLNPMPVFGLPVNYETENRFGYLTRDPAEYDNLNWMNPYASSPGEWAKYHAVRFDTYHRLTAPFRMCDDFLSVVPRVGYHGTFWNRSGTADLTGTEPATNEGKLFRSILEGGATFAARGEGWVNDSWRHEIEPYLDVLLQKAWYVGEGDRPYVFDSIDASVNWEDQFAGRSRNLPYSYYGVTPGLRNAWETLDERGNLHQVVDFDVYAAVQFNRASYQGMLDRSKLADVGEPNYGDRGCFISPGARLRWSPDDDISLLSRAEYDSDANTIALADVGWRQKLTEEFHYNVTYSLRDFRCWDYSTSSYELNPDTNNAKFHYVRVGFEQQPFDWFAWGPFVRWDIREQEMDVVGSYFDYLTDCLGFRLQVTYENEYTRIDGYQRDEDWSVGFFVYLRAFGAGGANMSY